MRSSDPNGSVQGDFVTFLSAGTDSEANHFEHLDADRIERNYQIEKIYASHWEERTFVSSETESRNHSGVDGLTALFLTGSQENQKSGEGLILSNCSDSGVDT